ncbi:MAG: hypothetical protein WCK33_08290 [Phycisphaerae bacterium]|jgi:hypothetical protein
MSDPLCRALGASDAVRHAARRPEAVPSRNPIITWLLAKSTPLKAYLDGLASMDLKLASRSGQLKSIMHLRRRLALTLLLDFAREQGLSIRELSLLLDDVQGAASDAMNHLIEASRGDRRPSPA